MLSSIDPALIAFATGMRKTYRLNSAAESGVPDAVKSIRHVTIDSINARIYEPISSNIATKSGYPVLMYIHGGGYVCGDLDTHDVIQRSFANAIGALVVAFEYRLAPEWPFPAAMEDSYSVLKWIHTNISEYGGDGSRIGVAGDSAGGQLAGILSQVTRDRNGPVIAVQALLYPCIDLGLNTTSKNQLGSTYFPTNDVLAGIIASYLPDSVSATISGGANNPYVSPLYGDVNRLPPAIVATAQFDPLRDEGKLYADKLSSAGVITQYHEYTGMQHGFIQFYKTSGPVAAQAFNESIKFITKYLSIDPALLPPTSSSCSTNVSS